MADLLLYGSFWAAVIFPLVLIVYLSIKYKSWLKSSLFLIGGAILGVLFGYGVVEVCFFTNGDMTCSYIILAFFQIGILLTGLAILSALVGLAVKIFSKN